MIKRNLLLSIVFNMAFIITGYESLEELPYEIFNTPDLIKIGNENCKIWSVANYIDSEKIVIENWVEVIQTEPGDRMTFLRIVTKTLDSDCYWDSGFIYGNLHLKYDDLNQKIIILRRTRDILEEETQFEGFSFLLDIKNNTLYKFLHRKVALNFEIIDSEVLLLEYRHWNIKIDEHEIRKMIINPEDLIKVK